MDTSLSIEKHAETENVQKEAVDTFVDVILQDCLKTVKEEFIQAAMTNDEMETYFRTMSPKDGIAAVLVFLIRKYVVERKDTDTPTEILVNGFLDPKTFEKYILTGLI
jgi:predicted DNA-binding protein (UPF0278 family)